MTKDPSRIHVPGALHPFAAGFVEWLTRHGYTPISATFQVQLMAHWSRWLTCQALDVRRLSTADVERFLRARHAVGVRDAGRGPRKRP